MGKRGRPKGSYKPIKPNTPIREYWRKQKRKAKKIKEMKVKELEEVK